MIYVVIKFDEDNETIFKLEIWSTFDMSTFDSTNNIFIKKQENDEKFIFC